MHMVPSELSREFQPRFGRTRTTSLATAQVVLLKRRQGHTIMTELLSRTTLDDKHLGSAHAHRAWKFKDDGWQYQIDVVLRPSRVRQAPAPALVTIRRSKDGEQDRGTVKPGQDDRARFVELVFLLAAKLKYDHLKGIPDESAGFLHSEEIARLNKALLTKVQKSLYASIGRLYRKSGEIGSKESSFISRFFVQRDQLWHLIRFCGATSGKTGTQDLIWWLGVDPNSVSFRDPSGDRTDEVRLKKSLERLFPKKYLLKPEDYAAFAKRLDLGSLLRTGIQSENRAASKPGKSNEGTATKPEYGKDEQEKWERGEKQGTAALVRGETRPTGPLYYLQTAQKVLRIGVAKESAQWFRTSGPIAADFADKRVYRRTILDELKKRVRENPVFMLKGIAATGKTVIARSLLYELYNEGRRDAYYFDIGPRRYFDEARLGSELETIQGICVIENVHLEPRKAQLIHERFKDDPERHILFTARHLDRRYEEMFVESLDAIPSLSVGSLDEVEGIIRCFCAHPGTPMVVAGHVGDVLQASGGNYWLLAFALKGCADAEGAGGGKSWIAGGVRRYLENLETCGDQFDEYYPEILLVLSRLYNEEALTAERYLTKKRGFPKSALQALTGRGEITRQKDPSDNTLYGLTHSALAKAYLDYGRKDVEGPKQQTTNQFLYDYATACAPNGISAIVVGHLDGPEMHVLDEIENVPYLSEIVASEESLHAIGHWLAYTRSRRVANSFCDIPSLLDILEPKLLGSSDLDSVGYCFMGIALANPDAAERLWVRMRAHGFPRIPLTESNIQDVAACAYAFYIGHPLAAAWFCEVLDLHGIAEILTAKAAPSAIDTFIRFLVLANCDATAGQVIKLIDIPKLGRRLSEAECHSVASVIENIDPERAAALRGQIVSFGPGCVK
jgi:hypothetical protein